MAIYSDDAIADLQAIRSQIAEDSPARAAEKAAMLDALCKLLDTMPNLGRFYAGPLRLFMKESWVIVYEPISAGILIHRIFDCRHDWRSQI